MCVPLSCYQSSFWIVTDCDFVGTLPRVVKWRVVSQRIFIRMRCIQFLFRTAFSFWNSSQTKPCIGKQKQIDAFLSIEHFISFVCVVYSLLDSLYLCFENALHCCCCCFWSLCVCCVFVRFSICRLHSHLFLYNTLCLFV